MKTLAFSVLAACAIQPTLASTTIEDRVAAQRALEEVYARHREPAGASTVPDAVLRAKVDRFLRESAALDRMWSTRIGADAVDRELARIAKQSLRPDILSDLFRALDSDPAKVAEYLVRPIVADRLARRGRAGRLPPAARLRGAARRCVACDHAGRVRPDQVEGARRLLVSRFRSSRAATGRLAAPGGRRRSRTYTRYAPDHRRPPATTIGPAIWTRTSDSRH